LPELIWTRLNLAWIVFFTFMGALNWYLAFVLFKGDTDAWVSLKPLAPPPSCLCLSSHKRFIYRVT
jgi:intracellular septation protein A